MKHPFKFKNIAFHIVFWVVVGVIFTQYSYLRPNCYTSAYKEILCALLIAIVVYFNKFILFPKIYLKGKYLLFLLINTFLVFLLGFTELQILEADIFQVYGHQLSFKEYSIYLIYVFILVSLRDAAFLGFFFITWVNRDFKYLLTRHQQLLALENKQIIVSLPAHKEILVNIKDIVYISGDRNCIVYHLFNNTTLKQYQTLAYIEDVLPKHLYLRINRSNIVFYRYVYDFNKDFVTIKVNDKEETINIPIQKSDRTEKYNELKMHFSTEKKKINGEIKKLQKGRKKQNKKDDSGEINEFAKQILETIRENQGIFGKAIKEKLSHISERSIDRYLRKLKNIGLIEYKGALKNGGYYAK